jgi:UDP-N-acetylglucosamine--N-acetylmuramyl-(pentapeptide) pyrophosphoryl-undecaprenol N-acetylglucosamine transferase
VYPALAVLQALESESEYKSPLSNGTTQAGQLGRRDSSTEVLWVGGIAGMEAELVRKKGLPYQGIPAAGVHGVGPLALPGNLIQVGKGLRASRDILRHFHPQVMLFTGGYVAVPVALAVRIPGLGIPVPEILLYVPDIEPGWALKILARFASHIAITVEATRRNLPEDKDITMVGYPTRQELKIWDRASALETLKLSTGLPILLVVGGSTGARSINRALLAILPSLLERMQVIHISGQRDWEEVQTAQGDLTNTHRSRYRPYPYLHAEMGAALTVADLVLSRSGASVIGEYPLFGLPAILVPYPHAWGYQETNARYLADRGAAIVIQDQDLSGRLQSIVEGLMQDKPRRQKMGQAMADLAQPEAAKAIATLLAVLAARQSGREV